MFLNKAVDKRLRKGTTSETKVDSKKGDKKDKKGGKIPESVSSCQLVGSL